MIPTLQVEGMHSDVATLSKASIWREASRIIYEEGFRAFWKGNLVTIAHRLPYSSISFYAYERYKNVSTNHKVPWCMLVQRSTKLSVMPILLPVAIYLLQVLQSMPGLDGHRENVSADVFVRLVGGGLAGVTAASMTYPLDLVRTRLAAQVILTHQIRICFIYLLFRLFTGDMT